MRFENALKKFRDGEAITDGDVVLKPSDKIHDLNLSMSMQCDWLVYEEPKKELKVTRKSVISMVNGDIVVKVDNADNKTTKDMKINLKDLINGDTITIELPLIII